MSRCAVADQARAARPGRATCSIRRIESLRSNTSSSSAASIHSNNPISSRNSRFSAPRPAKSRDSTQFSTNSCDAGGVPPLAARHLVAGDPECERPADRLGHQRGQSWARQLPVEEFRGLRLGKPQFVRRHDRGAAFQHGAGDVHAERGAAGTQTPGAGWPGHAAAGSPAARPSPGSSSRSSSSNTSTNGPSRSSISRTASPVRLPLPSLVPCPHPASRGSPTLQRPLPQRSDRRRRCRCRERRARPARRRKPRRVGTPSSRSRRQHSPSSVVLPNPPGAWSTVRRRRVGMARSTSPARSR